MVGTDVTDISLKPKDLKNPSSLVRKLLGVLEVGFGSALNGAVHSDFTSIVKDDKISSAIEALGGMLAAGAISQPDLSNIFAGFSSAPFQRWGAQILSMIKGTATKVAPSTGLTPGSLPSMSQGSSELI